MFPVGLCPDCGMMGCPRCRLQYSMIVKFKDFLRSCLEDYGKGRE